MAIFDDWDFHTIRLADIENDIAIAKNFYAIISLKIGNPMLSKVTKS